MKILRVDSSPVKNKRLRVFLDNGKYYDFGLDTGKTYLDHHDKDKRKAYWARHYTGREKQLIDNLTPSPALFSAYLLWGNSTNINTNIENLNRIF